VSGGVDGGGGVKLIDSCGRCGMKLAEHVSEVLLGSQGQSFSILRGCLPPKLFGVRRDSSWRLEYLLRLVQVLLC
jgi:hypothetical protein